MFTTRSAVALCVLLGLFVVIANCDKDDDEWEEFKKKHGKSYDNEEEHQMRKGLHKKTKDHVNKHNKEYAEGKHTYWLRVNHMADMTKEERRALLPKIHRAKKNTRFVPVSQSAPTTFKDWTTTGILPPVRDQQQCGSCWTFSSADTAAYYYAAANGLTAPLEFSTQQLVDCAKGYPGTPQDGCQGGTSELAFDYIQKANIDQDYSYPYTSGLTKTYGTCNPNASAAVSVFTDTSSASTAVASAGDEAGMANYVGSSGPGVVYVFAECDQFMHYGGGILSNVCASCTSNGQPVQCQSTDHAVMIVGYGQDSASGANYFKVKNSWNTHWGEQGYFRINYGTNELNVVENGIMYPAGVGKSATPASPLPFEQFCVLPANNTMGGACMQNCNSDGACCSSNSDCYDGVCDPNAKICMPPCPSSTDCNGGADVSSGQLGGSGLTCAYYSGSNFHQTYGATCVNGYCQCPA